MSVEKIVEQRVKKLEDNQEKLIQVDKISNIGLFGDILTGTNYEDWRKTNKIFSDGYATGLEEGLRDSFNTDKLVNTENLKDDRQKEFYQKFLELSKKYNCKFTFHPLHGMVLEDLELKEYNNTHNK
tara:strand:+ start:5040 stop:5420 length:381 start_codon:yes stop_codon:yes gene_type:complete